MNFQAKYKLLVIVDFLKQMHLMNEITPGTRPCFALSERFKNDLRLARIYLFLKRIYGFRTWPGSSGNRLLLHHKVIYKWALMTSRKICAAERPVAYLSWGILPLFAISSYFLCVIFRAMPEVKEESECCEMQQRARSRCKKCRKCGKHWTIGRASSERASDESCRGKTRKIPLCCAEPLLGSLHNLKRSKCSCNWAARAPSQRCTSLRRG